MMDAQLARFRRGVVVALSCLVFLGWSVAESAPATVKVDFVQGQETAVDLSVGSVRLTALKITADSRQMADSLLPPRGGQERYSWKRYEVHVENSEARRVRVEVHLRLLDAQGAVIDEFTLSSSVRQGRARSFSLRRLTLNYVVPLIRQVAVQLEVK